MHALAHTTTRTHACVSARTTRAHTHTRARAWANTSRSSEDKARQAVAAQQPRHTRHDADQRRPLIGTGPARRAQSVYGGYYASVGAEFFTTDFVDPDTFGAKIAKQFLFGVQARARARSVSPMRGVAGCSCCFSKLT